MTQVSERDAALDELLSRPLQPDVDAMSRIEGDLLVLGASGKMGPSLARLARRASDKAGIRRDVIGVARFGDRRARTVLEQAGVGTIPCDLRDPDAVAALPDAPNIVCMVGHKFGSADDGATTWSTNVLIPAIVAERYRSARIVAFSTGNVYPLWPVDRPGPMETDPVGPVGEYAMSALGRERLLENVSRRHGTPITILRLNYAVELRYGVLRDIADRVRSARTIDLAMGHVNVIWQRDANAVALRALEHAASPPLTLNLTGPERLSVRALAERFGERFGIEPRFSGEERATALLSDASRCHQLFGPPSVTADEIVEWVAEWVALGGPSLAKPTHYEEREGRF